MTAISDMTKPLAARPEPAWLGTVSEQDTIPVRDVLTRSLYYPACGRDGDPVRYLGGFTHSFVYADYVVSRDEIQDSLYDPRHGFRGYRVLFCKDVLNSIVSPDWAPSQNLQRALRRGRAPEHKTLQYALWAVMERLPQFPPSYGPARFSYLFFGGEGNTVYEATYGEHGIAPEVLAIIQCGIAFGGAWTDLADPDAIFRRTVRTLTLDEPGYLLYGGWGRGYERCCWPGYSHEVARWRAAAGELGLWRCDESPCTESTSTGALAASPVEL